MPVPHYGASDYQGAFQNMLPQGFAWPRDPDSIQSKVIAGLSPVYARSHQRAANLLVDAFPGSSIELLTEWESTLGLPDSSLGLAASLQGRRAQVIARLTAVGGQSIPYFVSLAQSLGFAISIAQSAPFRCGQSTAGQPVGDASWMFVWSVTAALSSITRFVAGASGAGEPLASWGNAVLESQIRKNAPAHSFVQFKYQ